MFTDISYLPVLSKSVQIVQMNGTLAKVPRKMFTGDFTQNGGASALSALFGAGGGLPGIPHDFPFRDISGIAGKLKNRKTAKLETCKTVILSLVQNHD